MLVTDAMRNDYTRKPEELVGLRIYAVALSTYEEPTEHGGGYKEITFVMEDGRRYSVDSCDCCGGMSFYRVLGDQ